jgi:hypothetical protein
VVGLDRPRATNRPPMPLCGMRWGRRRIFAQPGVRTRDSPRNRQHLADALHLTEPSANAGPIGARHGYAVRSVGHLLSSSRQRSISKQPQCCNKLYFNQSQAEIQFHRHCSYDIARALRNFLIGIMISESCNGFCSGSGPGSAP